MAVQAVPYVFTKPVRLLYTDGLMQAKPFIGEDGTKGAPRYSCQCLIPEDHPQLEEFKSLVLRLAREGLPAHVDEEGKWTPVGLKLAIKSGASLIAKANAKATALGRTPPDRSFYAGQYVLSVNAYATDQNGVARTPPRLVVYQNGQQVPYVDEERPLAKRFFYNGVLASVAINVKAFTGGDGGVTAYINRVLSVNSGEPINVGRSDEDVFGSSDNFSEYVGHVTAESPSAGMANPW